MMSGIGFTTVSCITHLLPQVMPTSDYYKNAGNSQHYSKKLGGFFTLPSAGK
jgi:hypothetical protein